ncbi:MAG: glycosyltransferase [Natronomonas sp.]
MPTTQTAREAMDIDTGEIAVNIPTTDSEDVIGETLDRLADAIAASPVSVDVLRVVDDDSTDETVAIVRERAQAYGWDVDDISRPTSLSEARQLLVDRTEADWFLFLDDDVRLTDGYLRRVWDVVGNGDAIGAVQGRKHSRDEHPSEWTRRRARRGGTHATLVRTTAVAGIEYPEALTVLEDEFTRRYVEGNGYLWVFDHQARFEHHNQGRHPIGWEEGVCAGAFGLAPAHQYALTIPHALATGRNPIPHAMRLLGWVAGRFGARETGIQQRPTGEVRE